MTLSELIRQARKLILRDPRAAEKEVFMKVPGYVHHVGIDAAYEEVTLR